MKKIYMGIGVIIAAIGVFAAGCLGAGGADRAYGTASGVEAVRQVIGAEAGERTVMWQSRLKETAPVLEYREKDGTIKESRAEEKELTADGKTIYIYTGQMKGLEEGKTYEYRVGYEDRRTDWKEMAAVNQAGGFTALIFPDSQSSDYSTWRNIVKTAQKTQPNAEFFINMGDLVDNGYDMNQWNEWFDAVTPMIERIPAVPVMGNHETYTLDWKVAMPEPYLHLFSLPANGSLQRQNQYYSFDYKNLHVTVLNTQIEEMEAFQPGLMEEQLAWLRQDLASAKTKWKIVLMHKDILRYWQTRHAPNTEIVFQEFARQVMPIFDEYQVDAVLTAHLHTYRRRGPIHNFQPGTEGPVYILTGVAGNVRYPGLWQENPLDVYVAPQPESDNYMDMEVTEDTMTFSSYFEDGRLMDRVVITK